MNSSVRNASGAMDRSRTENGVKCVNVYASFRRFVA